VDILAFMCEHAWL
jgi:hypothetical protein